MAAKGNEVFINVPAPDRNTARMARLAQIVDKLKREGRDPSSFEAELERRRQGLPKQPKLMENADG